MRKATVVGLAACLLAGAICIASTAAFAQAPAQKADYRQAGKDFVSAKFSANRESLIEALAPEVLLLGGHEYLKKEYYGGGWFESHREEKSKKNLKAPSPEQIHLLSKKSPIVNRNPLRGVTSLLVSSTSFR